MDKKPSIDKTVELKIEDWSERSQFIFRVYAVLLIIMKEKRESEIEVRKKRNIKSNSI